MASSSLLKRARPLRGVLLFLCALLLFACLDTTTKYLSQRYPVTMIVWMRYVVHALLMAVVLLPSKGMTLMRTHRTGLVWVRALSLAAMSLLMGLGLQRLPVAEATSIGFTAPMLVVLLARPVLGERIGWLRGGAVALGFIGVLLVARPGGSLDLFGVAVVLCAAVCGAAYQLLSRVLSSSERAVTMLFYTALAGCAIFGPLMPWLWGGPPPSWLDVLLFASLGFYGGLGHLFFTQAYRYAPASLLAPVSYLQLLWAALTGFIVLGHVPEPMALLGMLVIMVSGALVAVGASRG
ncbi:MAG: EamA family transporter [Candidatus Dactylopiibacterium carminicum]|nr:MAG: EamA family transporter [Candidatus Dactylopiibacterium carminicum]